jgi:hypothetical protein
VRALSPGHHATDVARGNRITLTFDQPMDIGSVESALSVTPSVPGTIVWDSPTRMNFVPSSFLTALTHYTVRLGGTAAGTNGLSLGAAFESFFITGTHTIPIEEVPLRLYQLDGALSAVEAASVRVSTNGISLYADFNGQRLYFATTAAEYPHDRFLFVTPSTNATSSAPWAKTGTVAGLRHYIGNEADNGWSGWFYTGGGGGGQAVAVPGGWLEGTLDPLAAFGFIPARLFVASVPYDTVDGGDLFAPEQCPVGDGNGNLEAPEYYLLHLAAFDTDGDGLPDLQEDANANGVFDSGETRPWVVDTDSDGMSDGEEYQAGTNPNDPQSLFVSDIQRLQGADQVEVRWMGLNGHAYTVWAADQLSGPWTATTMQDVSGAGLMLRYSEPTTPGRPARMFRVQVWRLP